MTTTDQGAVTVAQVDRDEAHAIAVAWDAGRYDEAGQLVARHRLASVSSASAEPFLAQLRRVNLERYEAWVEGADAGIMFDALELGGEVGELLNIVKKLEREERGWRGSRANPADFDDECADVLICLDKLARRRNVDLAAVTIAKFNATSDKVGLPHRLAASPEPVPATNQAGEVERRDHAREILAQAYDNAGRPESADRVRKAWPYASKPDELVALDAMIAFAALATQPATSQEGERERIARIIQREEFRPTCTGAALDDICALPPKATHYAAADRILTTTPTPPTLSEGLRALGQAIGAEIDRQCSIGAGTCGTADDGSGLFEVNASLDLNGFAQAMSRAALAQVKAS